MPTDENGLMYIDVKEFTNNVVTDPETNTVSGTGIFDELMNTATKHLQAQFNLNGIRREDYATSYIQVYQTTLQAALQAWLQKGIADKQMELINNQIEAEDAKKDLYRRQIKGFDDDHNYKILKTMLDSWAVGFSVARDSFEASGIPAPMQKFTIDDVFNKFIITGLSSSPMPTTMVDTFLDIKF